MPEYCEWKRFVKLDDIRRTPRPRVPATVLKDRGWSRFCGMGETSGLHPTVRCPHCGKRVRLKATYCVGGEWTGWTLPEHKVKETRKPGPRRKSKQNGRGK